MNAVFVDSSVWIDHFRGVLTPEVETLRGLLTALHPDLGTDNPRQVLVGDLVLLEVLRGISEDSQYARTRRVLLAFRQVALGGTAPALMAADHYRALRRRGVTIRKAVDCLIASWCITHGVPLLQGDRDFEPFVQHLGLTLLPSSARH